MCTDGLRHRSFPNRSGTRAQVLPNIVQCFANLSSQEWSKDAEEPRIGRRAAVAGPARKERPFLQKHFAFAAALAEDSV